MTDDTQQNTGTQKYALLAIMLPVLGGVTGAFLEHGTDFLCKTGLIERCRPTVEEVEEKNETIMVCQRATVEIANSLSASDASLQRVSAELQLFKQKEIPKIDPVYRAKIVPQFENVASEIENTLEMNETILNTLDSTGVMAR